eukprot:gene22526-33649_t
MPDFSDLLLRYTDVVSPARQRGQQNRGQETFHDANHPALQSPLRAAPPVRMAGSQGISIEIVGGGVSATERHHYAGVKQTAEK